MKNTQQFKVSKEVNPKCDFPNCGRTARYTIVYDYVYDGDRQVVLYATWTNACEEHGKSLIRTLKKSSKEFEVQDLIHGREVVQFT